MPYEFLEHTADVKFRASGSTIEGMFIEAAGALNETIRGDIKILELEEKSFEIEAGDLTGLLQDFLEEFLFLLDAENYLVSSIKFLEIIDETKRGVGVEGIGVSDNGVCKLKCVVVGDSADNYKFTNDVKAVTYSEMKILEKDGKWSCEVVLDV